MTFRNLELTDHGTAVSGTTRLGRVVTITLRSDGGRRRFEVAVSPMPGLEADDFNETAAEIELRRVMDEADAISEKLASIFGDDLSGTPDVELLRGAASVLDCRDVEPELVEALIGLAGGTELRAPGL